MDEKLAKAIEFIKLLRWQYPLPSTLDEIDKFVFECEKEAAEHKRVPDSYKTVENPATWILDKKNIVPPAISG